jgi:hypothetical protein
MNKQKSLVVHRSDDTHSLPHKSLKTRSSRMRDINAKTSNLSLGNNLSVNFNSELSSKAGQNGWGVVYNRSDCGYSRVRWYGFGGDGPGQNCARWDLTPHQRDVIWSNGDVNWICPLVSPFSSDKGYCMDYNGVKF